MFLRFKVKKKPNQNGFSALKHKTKYFLELGLDCHQKVTHRPKVAGPDCSQKVTRQEKKIDQSLYLLKKMAKTVLHLNLLPLWICLVQIRSQICNKTPVDEPAK